MSVMRHCDMFPERWICCQLGAREHYAIPRALALRGELQCLLTDAWVRPGSLPGLCNRKLRERFHAELAGSAVRACTAGLAAFELAARARRLSGWSLVVARNRRFQSRVADWLSGLAQPSGSTARRVLFSYSYTALAPFRVAKERGWRTVLGQIDPGPAEERIVSELCGRWPQYAGAWQPAPAEYWSAWRQECELADVVMVNSDWSRDAMLAEGVPAEKIAVAPLAYDPPQAVETKRRVDPRVFSPQRPLRVLFLGQANIRKGIHDLVSAAGRLRGEAVRFDVIGPHGPLPPLLPENVTFHGAVPRGSAGRWYQQADLFVLPTYSDGFALTQIEAMAHGLPVIATRRCGAVVQPGRNGWIIEAGNPEQLADVIGDAMGDPARLGEMSAAAVHRVADFSIERLADRLACIGPEGAETATGERIPVFESSERS
jgi:glycosyltransferase involved in cell wall biosynthesis